MAWNTPDNNNQKDPWKRRDDKEGPPHLDDFFKKLFGGLKKKPSHPAFQRHTSGGASSPSSFSTKSPWFWLSWGALGAVILYLASGIYVVQPTDQAVILRFGQYQETVGPGLHWMPWLIDTRQVINTEQVKTTQLSALMLTQSENIVSVSFAVQYRIGNPKDYLFNIRNPESALNQIVDSAVRQVIGQSQLDDILTTGRSLITTQVRSEIEKLINKYQVGLIITDVTMQPAKAPEEVKGAFDDVIKAREDRVRLVNEATSYANQVLPQAQGKAIRMTQEAEAAKQQMVLNAKAEVAKFLALLPQYKVAPAITTQRLYFETMQAVLAKNKVVLMDNPGQNMLYLPLPPTFAHTPDARTLQAASISPSSVSVVSPKTTAMTNVASGDSNPTSQYLRWQEAQ